MGRAVTLPPTGQPSGKGSGGDGAELSLGGQTGVGGLGHSGVRRALQAEGTACAEVGTSLVCSGKHIQIVKTGPRVCVCGVEQGAGRGGRGWRALKARQRDSAFFLGLESLSGSGVSQPS